MRLEVRVPAWAQAVISDLTDMQRAPHPVDATKVSSFTLDLPDDVRFEYAFLDTSGAVRADPERGATGSNPWFREITEVRGPAYVPNPLADPPPASWPVERHRLDARAFGDTRRVTVVAPPEGSGPWPVVVLHDGVAYQRLARTADVLAEQVRQGRARPALLVFVEPVDRVVEYAWDERHLAFVEDEVRALVRERYPTGDAWWAMGASLGGLAAATLGLRDPGGWTGVVAQGGAFLGSPHDRRHHGVEHAWVAERVEAGAGDGLRWVLDVGSLDWLAPVNRRVRDTLAARGVEVTFSERAAGHNWGCWRDGLPEVLAAALRPPADASA